MLGSWGPWSPAWPPGLGDECGKMMDHSLQRLLAPDTAHAPPIPRVLLIQGEVGTASRRGEGKEGSNSDSDIVDQAAAADKTLRECPI